MSLRLDNEEGYEIEEMLECVGIEIPLPDVPEPKSLDCFRRINIKC